MGGATVRGGQGGLGQKEGLSLLRCSGNSQGGLHTPEKANLRIWRCSEIIPDSKDRCKEMNVTRGPETWKQSQDTGRLHGVCKQGGQRRNSDGPFL